ncbi:MAG: hypothetical protein SOX11_04980 [Lachnospiraceae bacterium]|nr:hypothetical protein [Lachnospiraceae bacterium]
MNKKKEIRRGIITFLCSKRDTGFVFCTYSWAISSGSFPLGYILSGSEG